jgi:hypothetical protein
VDQDVLVRTDPVTRGKGRDLRAIEAGAVAVVKIFERCALLKLRELLEPPHAAVLPVQTLAIEQQREPLLEGKTLRGAVGHLIAQGDSHTVELQCVQFIERGLDKHESLSPSSVVVVSSVIVDADRK